MTAMILAIPKQTVLMKSLSRRAVLQWSTAAALMAINAPALAEEIAGETAWKRILRTKTIRVGTVGTTKSSRVGLDGSFTGISPEILRQVMAPNGALRGVPSSKIRVGDLVVIQKDQRVCMRY